MKRPIDPINDLSCGGYYNWDAEAQNLLIDVLPKAGFECVAFTRLPYLSHGDVMVDYSYLDAVLLLAKKVSRD